MAPYILVARQKPILEKKKGDMLKKVCRRRPSITHLEPKGALGFSSVSLFSRVKADVVATRLLSSTVAAVVDSSIVVEGGDQKMIGSVFRSASSASGEDRGDLLLKCSQLSPTRRFGLWNHEV